MNCELFGHSVDWVTFHHRFPYPKCKWVSLSVVRVHHCIGISGVFRPLMIFDQGALICIQRLLQIIAGLCPRHLEAIPHCSCHWLLTKSAFRWLTFVCKSNFEAPDAKSPLQKACQLATGQHKYLNTSLFPAKQMAIVAFEAISS